jgi:hypothetical protein
MGRGVKVWMLGMTLLALVAPAAARPPYDLSMDELRFAMTQHASMASYIHRNGLPDLAVSRFLADKPPWDHHEVALYYFELHKEIDFARAYILGEPTIQLERYERPLTDAEIEQLRPRAERFHASAAPAPETVASVTPDPASRAEAAAARAEAAAGRVESAADAADRAADHAEAVAAKTEKSFHKNLKK